MFDQIGAVALVAMMGDGQTDFGQPRRPQQPVANRMHGLMREGWLSMTRVGILRHRQAKAAAATSGLRLWDTCPLLYLKIQRQPGADESPATGWLFCLDPDR